MSRSPGTISRELDRNLVPIDQGVYRPHRAQKRAEERWYLVGRRPRMRCTWVRWYVSRQIVRGWSPKLIAGRIALLRPNLAVSHETIYQWIYLKARHLIRYLPRRHRTRKRRGYTRKHGKTLISYRIPIARRPRVANERRRLGDWEADTIVTRQGKEALQIVVDRKSRYTVLNRLPRKTAKAMRAMLKCSLGRLPRAVLHTITYDNGLENMEHQNVNVFLGTRSYFCTPYTSQERGTVENTAGLVRRFFPKKTDFGTLNRRNVKHVERWLNHRPRVILKFQTPAEIFRSGVALEP